MIAIYILVYTYFSPYQQSPFMFLLNPYFATCLPTICFILQEKESIAQWSSLMQHVPRTRLSSCYLHIMDACAVEGVLPGIMGTQNVLLMCYHTWIKDVVESQVVSYRSLTLNFITRDHAQGTLYLTWRPVISVSEVSEPNFAYI